MLPGPESGADRSDACSCSLDLRLALADVASRLAAAEGSRAFRLGGDEFALLVAGPSERASAQIERIQQTSRPRGSRAVRA